MKNKEINFNNLTRNALYAMLAAVLFAGCADVTPIEQCAVAEPYGFWGGLWHGIKILFI